MGIGIGRRWVRHKRSPRTRHVPLDRLPRRPCALKVWFALSHSLACRPSGWVDTIVFPNAGSKPVVCAWAAGAAAIISAAAKIVESFANLAIGVPFVARA